jgi:hypothetical protein
MTHEGANNDPAMRATGPALRDYLHEHAESTDSLSHFSNTMAGLLADRLDGSPDGVVPKGYIIATQLLLYDCKDTGKDGFSGEPMPRDVTGQPPMMYGMFQVRSIELAREVFGNSFADEVKKEYTAIKERVQTAQAEEVSKKPELPKLTDEQIDGVFGAIAKGDTTGIQNIDKSQAYEILKKVEGVDPVEAVLDGHAGDIPQEGWIVDARMELGTGAVVNVFHYGEDAEFKRSLDSGDSREEYGEAAIWTRLNGYGQYALAYESPEFPQSQRDKEPYDRMSKATYTGLSFDRMDITELKSGGRILDEKRPLKGGKGGYGGAVGWTDINRLAEKDGTRAKLARVTDDPTSMQRIVAQVGYAMGMDGQDLETLLATIKVKTETI